MNKKALTILVVDDSETNIDILVSLLNAYDVAVALNGESALEIANEDEISLILLDIMMPKMDGYEVCKRLKADPKTSGIPVIFITAKVDEDAIEMAYDVGGIDYVSKPFKPKELLARVKTQIEMQLLIDKLSNIISYDYMTGVYSRRKFFELATEVYKRDKSIFVAMIDIDRFKSINDRYGHPFGDKAIKTIATTISECLDEDAIFGRIGGEEFAVVFENLDLESVKDKIEFIRQSVQSVELNSYENDLVSVTISSGISEKKETTPSLDYLMKEADDALYEAKNGGRNRSIFRI